MMAEHQPLNDLNEIKRRVDETVEAEHRAYATEQEPCREQDADPIPEQIAAERKPETEPEQAEGDSSKTDVVESLNKKHAVIMLAGKCLILNHVIDPTTNRQDINFSGLQDFRGKYQNRKIPITINSHTKQISIAEIWLNSPDRKEYQDIVFDPSHKENPGVYNLWQGFAIMPKRGSWVRMKQHIRQIICSNDPETFKYLMAWMARLVQDPGSKRPGVAVVLRGKQGVGKGIFVINFGTIFGSHFRQIISHHLVAGRFNAHFKDALLVFVDEGFWGGDKQAEGILKGMITEEFITVEPKGKEAFTLKNHCNFIFASNSTWVVPASEEERRFFVMDVAESKMGDIAYFKALNEEMENGGREAMLHDLLHINITGVNLWGFPRRDALLDQIILTWPAEKKFWYETLRAGYIRNNLNGNSASTVWPDTIDCDVLYSLYSEFATTVGERFKSIDKVFGKKFKELCPAIERKQHGNGLWYYRLPPLNVCRDKLESLVKIKINWNG